MTPAHSPTGKPCFHHRWLAFPVLLLLSACGGASNDVPPVAAQPDPGSSPPPTPGPSQDKTPPTVSASATVSSDVVTLNAKATDEVGVTSVSFFVDDGVIQGQVQKNPSDNSFSLQIPVGLLAVGTHSLVALASDAAGNSATSQVATFTIGTQASDKPDTTPPTVSAAVEGNFGLVKLTAIATDDGRVDAVYFSVDGSPTPVRATPAFESSDPANQYFARFDTSGLTSGPHYLIARARDRSLNMADSAQVVFNVDPAAGTAEIEANDDLATATVIARNQLQIAGALKTRQIATGEFTELAPDYDYFRVSLAAGETLSVNMLSTQGFFLSILDAHQTLSNPRSDVSSDVINVSYTNGAVAQDVYIQVTSGPYDFKTNNQYKLSLTYR